MAGTGRVMANSAKRVYVKAHASLRISADDLDPSEVTRHLRLPPDHVHRRGDLNIGRSSKGKVIEYAPYASGLWSMSSEKWVESPRVETHIRWLLDQIAPSAEALARLLHGGADGDIFCYSTGRTSTPPAVPKELRDRAAALGLRVGVDHYPMADADPGVGGVD